ncbi:MAG: type II 3-dehydroquinate dehydratase [Saprospiraceae bacterium]|nr:type II 3-dehydroquinate dehydratase [Saprospiraceae bacterium]
MKVLILNGPNLNLIGQREPDIYGTRTFEEAKTDWNREFPGMQIELRQSQHEGVLIEWIQGLAAEGFDGLILNAGGLSHTSVVLADALAALSLPAVEVHISNIHAREPFRHTSLTGARCRGVVTGFGIEGYALALIALQRIAGR